MKIFKKVMMITALSLCMFIVTIPAKADEVSNDDVWYTSNGNAVSEQVDTVLLYDSRTSTNRVNSLSGIGTDYYRIYNHLITLKTTTEPYRSQGVEILLSVSIRVDYYSNSAIKKVGKPDVYKASVKNLAGSPVYTYSASAYKVSTYKYRVSGTGTITSIPYSPSFSGYVQN